MTSRSRRCRALLVVLQTLEMRKTPESITLGCCNAVSNAATLTEYSQYPNMHSIKGGTIFFPFTKRFLNHLNVNKKIVHRLYFLHFDEKSLVLLYRHIQVTDLPAPAPQIRTTANLISESCRTLRSRWSAPNSFISF